ncbi:MAG: hypothetical protein HOL31_07850 [Candidatus Scalindua sp.]|jgi:hypothetical protein|nr:hypothetical protein [Candidatus Scalindua sp.]
MDYQCLDSMIDRLGSLLPRDQSSLFNFGTTRSNWKEFWDYASKVQQGFNSKVQYPTGSLRQEAWDRFNRLRNEASRRGDAEHEALRNWSAQNKSTIISMCNGIKYSPFVDMLFFFDKTRVEQVKAWQRYLGDAMRKLSELKHQMIGEHKQECYERIQEIKESHDLFWQQHKEAWETRNHERERNHSGYIARVERNIEKNKERLRKATNALERQQERAREIRSKIRETTSSKWEGIFSEWLSEAESKIDDIESSISQISDWIDEDQRKL